MMVADPHCPSIAIGHQPGLWAWRDTAIWPPHACDPKPKKRRTTHRRRRARSNSRRGYRRLLVGEVTKDGTRVTIRIGAGEAKELAAICAEEGMSLSDALREALWEYYRIGTPADDDA